jgi:YbbR domain-containing protein
MENKKKTKLQLITQSRVFWMILSFLGALILWMYVTTTEGVEVETTLSGIRIEFLGADALRESSGLIVTEQDRSALNLTLRSTRRVLRQLNSSNVTAIINLNRVTGDGRYTVAYDISYPSGVSADEVTVVRASADVINFYVDRQLRLTIPVEGNSPAERRRATWRGGSDLRSSGRDDLRTQTAVDQWRAPSGHHPHGRGQDPAVSPPMSCRTPTATQWTTAASHPETRR